MGSLLSKVVDEFSSKSSPEQVSTGTPKAPITSDPRSPATLDVDRTPLPFSLAQNNQNEWDPRSPTAGIVRTPLQPPAFETPPDTPVAADGDGERLSDPRSPNCEVERTPIVMADCDVHRTWDDTDLGTVEGDSLFPNPPSIPRFNPDVSEDNSCLSDYGSYENYFLNESSASESEGLASTSQVANEQSCTDEQANEQSCANEPANEQRCAKEQANEQRCTEEPASTENCTDELINEKNCPVDLANQANSTSEAAIGDIVKAPGSVEFNDDPNVSPLVSPIKSALPAKSIASGLSPRSENVSAGLRCSTPNKAGKISGRAGGGLSQRDTNSPLSILQRKQTSKLSNQLTIQLANQQQQKTLASGHISMQDKENISSS